MIEIVIILTIIPITKFIKNQKKIKFKIVNIIAFLVVIIILKLIILKKLEDNKYLIILQSYF